MWLVIESAVLQGIDRIAAFLILLPFAERQKVSAWAHWVSSESTKWIGPRHTNFPDGSICAFHPTEGAWKPGGDLVNLIDRYTIWAAKHLHLENFDYWPGFQHVPHPYERLAEFRDKEFCGCANYRRRYIDCCKNSDLKHDRVDLMLDFFANYAGGLRSPPPFVKGVIMGRNEPPTIQQA